MRSADKHNAAGQGQQTEGPFGLNEAGVKVVTRLQADIERLRAQNRTHAERRDQEAAGLQKKVARMDHLMAEARKRMENAAVDWTTDPPSQQPGGWWRYTSINNVYEATVLVAEIDRLREELEWIYAEPEDALKVQARARAALDASSEPSRSSVGPQGERP